MTMCEVSSIAGIRRFSSRRERLDRSFLCKRLQGAKAYDRIAGYFCSSVLEVVGEALESVEGPIRMVCNSDLDRPDVQTAKAAQMAMWRSWCAFKPEELLRGEAEPGARDRFRRLFDLLRSGKLHVRVLPDDAFGLIHGKAGVVTLADGSKTGFIGSANESQSAWRMSYELVWEDSSPEAVTWLQEEFDALWSSPHAIPLAAAVVQDLKRLAEREVVSTVGEWTAGPKGDGSLDPAPAVIETPVYRKEVGLWEHQKYFAKMAIDAHLGPTGKARFVLADQVGLGKTLQLAMAAQLIALTGEKPILVICPKTLIWQWQGELLDLLDMPSAVWNGRQWVDEHAIEYPAEGPEGIRRCPRRVGIVSGGLISRGSDAAKQLLNLYYDCVILDESHRARRRNLGQNRDGEALDPNNLLRFMYRLAERTRSLLLATATPVQLRPVEAWDLLDVLGRGDESVLGNPFSRWRRAPEGLDLVMGRITPTADEGEQWEWIRNPMPPKTEHKDFEILRRRLGIPDEQAIVRGDALTSLGAPERARLVDLFPRLVQAHNPFIRRIVRRTRQQLETQIDPETNEPFLKPIAVELLGEGDREAILLPPYLREAYQHAEDFCRALGGRMQGSGFLKTLLLRRVGSSIHAGLTTAQRMLASWETIETADHEDDDEEAILGNDQGRALSDSSKTLTPDERTLLDRFVAALEANKERDPKCAVVLERLRDYNWLEHGCIVFSQYRDSIQWLAEHLTEELPDEAIALYSGPGTSGIMRGGRWTPTAREDLKRMVSRGRLRLLLGTDAASEGLNLQRLARLINLDLPWNPTRLEQRKGRIQRIGQVHDTIQIYNMRYKDSVEDRVHQLLSTRLHDIYQLFGQIPDVLEDAWVAMALGEKEQAKKIIDELPTAHPFEVRYTKVEKIDWESCRKVLDAAEKRRVLSQGW
jgi:superfamily II DNA or RNA helicase